MAKYKYTAEQDEWLRKNAEKYLWRVLAEKFFENFGEEKNFRTLKSHCTSTLKCAPHLNGYEKGQKGPGTLPIGSEREAKNGYIYVKISDERISRKNKHKCWRAKSTVEWEKQNNRKLPKGYTVSFLNGNKKDFSRENLIALPLSVEGKLGMFKKQEMPQKINKVYALTEYYCEILKEIDCKEATK